MRMCELVYDKESGEYRGNYRDMTPEEIKSSNFELSPELRISDLKQMLADTDYKIIKMAEGESTLEECSEIIAKRKAWRKEINELEAMVAEGVTK